MRTRTLFVPFLACLALGAVAQPGTLDTDFGTNGYVTTAVGGGNTVPRSLIVLPDGKILTLCSSYASSADIALVQYLADGSLDASFGTGGIVTLDVSSGSEDHPTAMLRRSDGSLLICGTTNGDVLLMGLNADGSRDLGFGTNGYTTVDLVAGEEDACRAMVVRPSGNVVLVGDNEGGEGNGIGGVMQFTANGTLDPSFGTNGVLTIDWAPSSTTEHLEDAALSPSGELYVAGDATPLSGTTMQLYRVTTAGALDATFDADGRLDLSFAGDGRPTRMRMQPDGKVLLGGYSQQGGADPNPFLARFNANGSADNSFGTTGVQLITSVISYTLSDIVVETSGNLLITGSTLINFGTDMLIARLHADGSFDPSFGTGGLSTFLLGGPGALENGVSLALAADGDYLMTGLTGDGFTGTLQQVLLKYRSSAPASVAEESAARPHAFPNPTTGLLQFTSPVAGAATRYQLLDVHGRTAADLKLVNGRLQIPTSVQEGTYMLLPTDRSTAPLPIVLVR